MFNAQSPSKFVVKAFMVMAHMAVLSGAAQAAPPVTAGKIIHSGTGCIAPLNSAISATPASTFSIYFNELKIPFNSKPADQTKTCILQVQLTPPPGYKLSVHPAKYDGEIAALTTGQLTAGHQFAGTNTAPFAKTIAGRKAFSETNLKTTNFSGCGQPSMLDDKITLAVGTGDPAAGYVKAAHYTLNLQPCK